MPSGCCKSSWELQGIELAHFGWLWGLLTLIAAVGGRWAHKMEDWIGPHWLLLFIGLAPALGYVGIASFGVAGGCRRGDDLLLRPGVRLGDPAGRAQQADPERVPGDRQLARELWVPRRVRGDRTAGWICLRPLGHGDDFGDVDRCDVGDLRDVDIAIDHGSAGTAAGRGRSRNMRKMRPHWMNDWRNEMNGSSFRAGGFGRTGGFGAQCPQAAQVGCGLQASAHRWFRRHAGTGRAGSRAQSTLVFRVGECATHERARNVVSPPEACSTLKASNLAGGYAPGFFFSSWKACSTINVVMEVSSVKR